MWPYYKFNIKSSKVGFIMCTILTVYRDQYWNYKRLHRTRMKIVSRGWDFCDSSYGLFETRLFSLQGITEAAFYSQSHGNHGM